MPDLLIVIIGLWLIWLFKLICRLKYLSCLILLHVLVFIRKVRLILKTMIRNVRRQTFTRIILFT